MADHARENAYDTIVVIDLESTCWEGAPPPGEISDIIEIGICELNLHTLELGWSGSILVTPTRSEVSEFCTKLTGHTQESLERASHTPYAAFEHLANIAGKRPWASWGAYDRKMIETTARELDYKVPVSRQHINVKTLFTVLFGLSRELGMKEALEHIGMPLEGRHHSGVDDARNIARILARLISPYRVRLGKGE